eukprot:365471-Chlamydomonas_euryale.AAC.31
MLTCALPPTLLLRPQVYVLHVGTDASGAPRFDYLSDYAVTQPILSATTTCEAGSDDGDGAFQLYTVQTEGIQQYTLFTDACLPPAAPEAVAAAAAPADLGGDAQLAEAALGPAAPQVAPEPPLLSPADVMHQAAGAGGTGNAAPTAPKQTAARKGGKGPRSGAGNNAGVPAVAAVAAAAAQATTTAPPA